MRKKGVTCVSIIINLIIRLIGAMPYMIILLALQTDHPSLPSNMEPTSFDIAGLSTMLNEFLKWYEDSRIPVPLRLLHAQIYLLLVLLMDLGFLTQVSSIILRVTNLCFLLCLLQVIYLQLPWLMDLRCPPMVLLLFILFLIFLFIMF